MATHSSILAWRIPGTGEPHGLPSVGSHRVGHDWSDLAAAVAAVWACFGFFFLWLDTLTSKFESRSTHDYSCMGVRAMHTQSLSTLCTPWTVILQAPLSMGFFRQEYWCGLPFPSPRDLPDPGIKPGSPALQEESLPSEPPGNVQVNEEIHDLNQVSLLVGFVLLFCFMSEPECIEVYLYYWINVWMLESGWHDFKFWFYSLLAQWPWENYHSLYKHQHFSSIRWGNNSPSLWGMLKIKWSNVCETFGT